MVWKYLIESNTFQVIYGIIYTQESRIFCYPDNKMNYFATYKKLYEYIMNLMTLGGVILLFERNIVNSNCNFSP